VFAQLSRPVVDQPLLRFVDLDLRIVILEHAGLPRCKRRWIDKLYWLRRTRATLIQMRRPSG
jgi:hypothetical protein